MLRPLGIGELLDVAIKIFRQHARPLLRIGLVIIVPVQLVGIVLGALTIPDDVTYLDQYTGTTAEATNAGGYFAAQAITGLLGGIATLLATAASVKAISDAWMGAAPDWRESLRAALRRSGSLIWLVILAGALLMLGFIALVVPGIWLSLACALAFPALMVEGFTGWKAIKRGIGLMRHRWWPTFAVIFLGYLLASILSGIFGALIGGVLFGAGGAHGASYAVANGIATAGAAVLTTPFNAAIITLAYYDLRVRKEGLDLELLADGLGLPAAEARGEPFFRTGPAPTGPGQASAEPPFWPPPPGWQPPPGSSPSPPG